MTEHTNGSSPDPDNEARVRLGKILGQKFEDELQSLVEEHSTGMVTGSYNMVRVVVRATRVASDVQRGNPLSRLLKRATDAGSREVKWADERDMLSKISVQVVQRGTITQGEIDAIPMGDTFRSRRTHGNLMLAISAEYAARIKALKEQEELIKTTMRPGVFEEATDYHLGLIYSDFFEVLPGDKAAAILLSCADPEVSETHRKGGGHQGLAGDTQQIATEAIVMMPREVRQDIFREMVKIDPKSGGMTDTLYRNLVANFYQSGTSFGGANMILMNLKGEAGQEKVIEFADDFGPLGGIVRSKH